MDKIKNPENLMKFVLWLVALVCVTVLVSLGKVKPDMIAVILSYLAGVVVKDVGSSRANPLSNMIEQKNEEDKADDK